MSIERIREDDEISLAYVRVVKAGGFVFLSGVGGRDPSVDDTFKKEGKTVVVKSDKGYAPTVEEQFELAVKRVKHLLAKAGTSMDKVVRVTLFLADIRDREKLGAIMEKHFSKSPPTWQTYGGVAFGRPTMRLELEVTALA